LMPPRTIFMFFKSYLQGILEGDAEVLTNQNKYARSAMRPAVFNRLNGQI
jgi:hypothetical protein